MSEIFPGARADADKIPLSAPTLVGNERAYVLEALDSGWLATGPFVERLERAVADYLGVRHAVATASGTAALHVALIIAGVRPGDAVLVPTLTFIAPANAVRYVGADPLLLDVEPDHWQLDVETVREFLKRACRPVEHGVAERATGRRVGAILPVHVLGHPVDLAPLVELAAQHELPLVADATESLGARYRYGDGRWVQAAGVGSVACLSFNGNKVVTSAGGGMIVTDDDAIAERAAYLVSQAKDDPLENVHGEVGFNYRLSNVHAAIGLAQLEQIDHLVAARRRIAGTYRAEFARIDGVKPMREAPWAESTFWLSTVRVDESTFGIDSRALIHSLAARGVQSRPLWQPLHRSRPYAGSEWRSCRVADRAYAQAVTLPSSADLNDAAQCRVIEAVRRAVG